MITRGSPISWTTIYQNFYSLIMGTTPLLWTSHLVESTNLLTQLISPFTKEWWIEPENGQSSPAKMGKYVPAYQQSIQDTRTTGSLTLTNQNWNFTYQDGIWPELNGNSNWIWQERLSRRHWFDPGIQVIQVGPRNCSLVISCCKLIRFGYRMNLLYPSVAMSRLRYVRKIHKYEIWNALPKNGNNCIIC